MKLTELRAKYAAAIDAAKAVKAQAETDDRDLTDDEVTAIDGHLAEAESLQTNIKAAETRQATLGKLDQAVESLDTPEPRRTAANAGDPVKRRERVEVGEAVISQLEHWGFERGGKPDAGAYLTAIRQKDTPGGAVDRRLQLVAAATGMQQGVGADGGFAVMPAFESQIWDGMNQAGVNILGMTDSFTVDGDSLSIPANAETSRATGSRWGGVRGYWVAEADQITASAPKLRQVKVEPQQLACLVYVTDKLLRNASTSLEQYVQRSCASEINFLIGDAVFNGTGVGQPLGIISHPATVEVAKEGSQAADTINAANLRKMFSRLHARSRANAAWFINQDCEPQIWGLEDGAGNPLFVGGGRSIAGPPEDRLFNRPVIVTEWNRTVGDAGDIVLGDMKAYVTGVKGTIESAMSMHIRFDYAETAFRFMFAVDGQPYLASAITPAKGSNTFSAFVQLAARA